MKKLSTRKILKERTYELTEKGKRVTKSTVSMLMAVTFIISLVVPAIGTLSGQLAARAQLVCSHIHDEECDANLNDHECSIETGCEPIRTKTSTIISAGHTHGVDCYITTQTHEHDTSCYSEPEEGGEPEEAGETGEPKDGGETGAPELICGASTEPGFILICELEETPDVIEVEIDTDAEPIGWICRYVPELICEHKDCAPDEPCRLDSGDASDSVDAVDASGTIEPRGLTDALLLRSDGYRYKVTDGIGTEVGSYYWLKDAVTACASNAPVVYTITVLCDDPDMTDRKGNAGIDGVPPFLKAGTSTLNVAITIPANKKITLKSDSVIAHTIKQEGDARHFTVEGTLILEDVIIEGVGRTGLTGEAMNGGIDVKGTGALTVGSGAVITKNFRNGNNGGGGVVSAGTVEVRGGKIIGNVSAGSGGGIHSTKSGKDAVIIRGGEISGNQAKTGSGISSSNNDSVIEILSKSEITGNGKSDGPVISTIGGGIWTSGTLIIKDSTVSGNEVANGGGGIYAYGPATVASSIISDNKANQGGGIFANNNLEIKDSTISGNEATGFGGGISISSPDGTDKAVLIDGSAISGNWAGTYGGGIYTLAGGSKITIMNETQITGNGIDGGPNGDVKTARGGGVYTSGTLLIENSTVSGNAVTNEGGGIYSNNNTEYAVAIDNSVISGNWASGTPAINGYGGGIFAAGSSGTVTIRNNSQIVGNGKDSNGIILTQDGGGVNAMGYLNIANSAVSGNAATRYGGGILMQNLGKLTIDKTPATADSSIFTNNLASFASKIHDYDLPKYAENIFITDGNWSFGIEKGFNNYDVGYIGELAVDLGYAYVIFNRNHDDAAGWTDADPSVMMLSKGQPIGNLPEEPARRRNAFTGWATAPGGGTAFVPGTVIKGNMTVYAQWGPALDLVDIIFDKNHSDADNNWTEAFPKTGSFERHQPLGAKMPKPPTRAGYMFDGWNTKKDGSGISVSAATTIKDGDEDYTVYAQWTQGYTVFFHINHNDTSGFTYPDPRFVSVADGSPIGPGNMPKSPARQGYFLTGWNTSPNGSGDEVTGSYIVNTNTDAYAQWSSVKKVTFHIISLDGVAGPIAEDKQWSITTEDKTLEKYMPGPSAPSGSGRYPTHYQVAAWYTGYDSAENKFTGKVWNFEKDTLLDEELHLYALDNVMWDAPSAKRAIGQTDFKFVLVRNSFALDETLNVAKTMKVTMRSLGNLDKIITTQGNYRHLNVIGELTQSEYITLTSNDVSQNGGGVEVNPGGTFILAGGRITGNSAESGGGVRSSGIFIMSGGEISGNVATSAGGGIYSSNNTEYAITITGGSISGNRTTSEVDASGQGGGIYANSGDSTITITGAQITGNGIDSEGKVTTNRGGGVYAFGSLLITNSTISGNAANQNGGGTYSNVLSTEVTDAVVIDNSVISGNWTTVIWGSGGGIYAGGQSGTVTIRNGSQIIGNGKNSEGVASTEDGGGIFSSLPLQVMNSAVSGNTVTRYGGGIRVQEHKATLLIENSAVSGNAAALLGGGIHSDNKSDDTTVNAIVIDRGVISGNWTTTTSTEDKIEYGKGGGIYSVGLVTIKNGSQITGNGKNAGGVATTNYGGGIYSVGALKATDSAISGNAAAVDGGGIFVYDFNKLSVDANVIFSGNTAGGAYWLGAYKDTGTYTPRTSNTQITVSALKALHGPLARIKTTTFSEAPGGNATPFNYLANNYDLNFNGTDVPLIKPLLEIVPGDMNYGTGTLPTRRTLYGLYGGTVVAGPFNQLVNEDAQPVTDLTFHVENPLSDSWRLDLHCTPFTNGSSIGAAPVAVDKKGVPVADAFRGNNTITVYNSEAFTKDLADGDASIIESCGAWNWGRLLYDIKADAEPGKQISTDYQSLFTWTFTVGP